MRLQFGDCGDFNFGNRYNPCNGGLWERRFLEFGCSNIISWNDVAVMWSIVTAVVCLQQQVMLFTTLIGGFDSALMLFTTLLISVWFDKW